MIIKLAEPGISFQAEDACTQKFGFLARSGAGKTYAAGVLIEGMLRAHQQVVILDPVGVFFGLRLLTDGKGPGFSIPIFGGLHGDLPLAPSAGALVAQLIVERNTPAVLDVSDMRKGKQREFITAFAEELFHLKKKTRSPLHLVLEEAHEFAPQHAQKGEERMLGAVEDLVRLGRNYGIGCTLISQRPQAVAKAILNQVEVLVALQTNGAHERKAIAQWAHDNTDSAIDIDKILPSLAVGEALVWSPQWLKLRVRCTINKKTTFDASSTPTAKTAKATEPKPLSGADIDALKKAMESVEEEGAKNDPKKMRARIAELERDVAAEKNGADYWTKIREENTSLRQSLERERVIAAEAVARLTGACEKIKRAATDCEESLHDMQRAVAQKLAKGAPPSRGVREITRVTEEIGGYETEKRLVRNAVTKMAVRQVSPASGLKKGARTMLNALAQAGKPLTRTQVATLSGLSPSSGTFSSYLSSLRTEGFVDEQHGKLALTERGNKTVNGSMQKLSAADVRSMWMGKLKAGARRMLQAVIDHPDGVTRQTIAEVAGISASSGTFSSYLSSLRSNGLIFELDHGDIFAVEELL